MGALAIFLTAMIIDGAKAINPYVIDKSGEDFINFNLHGSNSKGFNNGYNSNNDATNNEKDNYIIYEDKGPYIDNAHINPNKKLKMNNENNSRKDSNYPGYDGIYKSKDTVYRNYDRIYNNFNKRNNDAYINKKKAYRSHNEILTNKNDAYNGYDDNYNDIAYSRTKKIYNNNDDFYNGNYDLHKTNNDIYDADGNFEVYMDQVRRNRRDKIKREQWLKMMQALVQQQYGPFTDLYTFKGKKKGRALWRSWLGWDQTQIPG